MGWMDLFGAPADPETYTAPRGIPSPDEPRTLALYKYDSCPFCQRVLRTLKKHPEIEVELRDTLRDAAHRRALHERTGRTTVPCLFVDDVPFFESEDIVAWLGAYAIRGGAASTDEAPATP